MTAEPQRPPSRPDASPDRERRATFLAAGLMLVALLVAYHNSFHVPLLLDDDRAITQNATIRQLWPPSEVWSPPKDSGVSGRPVLNLTYALNYAAGGLQVGGYHAVNLAVHLFAALTLFGIIRRTLVRWSALTPTGARPRRPRASALGSTRAPPFVLRRPALGRAPAADRIRRLSFGTGGNAHGAFLPAHAVWPHPGGGSGGRKAGRYPRRKGHPPGVPSGGSGWRCWHAGSAWRPRNRW